MISRSRLLGVALVAGLSCGPPSNTIETVKPPDQTGDKTPLPPAVPAEVKADTTEPTAGHDAGSASPLLAIMAGENKRWHNKLSRDRRFPGYYIGYQITDKRHVVIEAQGGALEVDADKEARNLDVEVRVGTPDLDSRRPLRNLQVARFANTTRTSNAPRGTDKKAIQHHLWLETDRRYREAITVLDRVLNEERVIQSQEAKPPDFSHEKKEEFIQAPKSMNVDKPEWRRRIRACSKRADAGIATVSTCRVDFEVTTAYYVDSDGSKLQQSWTSAKFAVQVGVKADDGMPLSRIEQSFADTPDGLPSDDQIDEMIKLVNKDLDDLHKSPVVDPYVGPAILEGRAAAVFFHEVFGHRVEGHRQKNDISGQTFSTQVGEKIMPAWLTVYDDPTFTRLNGRHLNGFYRFDDEGVRAQRASLVDGGVLKGFVQGRQPISGFKNSNGHGRKEPGFAPVSRQGNLVVEASRSVTKDALYEQLIAEVKKAKKPYGMVFTDISGGFTNTSRFEPQAFKVNPVMAYRVYADGKRELVRGVDIVGTPLTALGNIVNAGRPVETFNGMCGAESGWVPVSASAPSLLLRQLEVERGFKPVDVGPILPSPSIRGGAR